MQNQVLLPRNELLAWINEFLCTSYKRLEDASNGAVACQLIDAIYPQSIPMKQLDFSASTPYDCQKNYNILKRVVSKLNLPLNFDINVLSKQGSKESYEFLSKLKTFFDDNYKGNYYDAVTRRKSSKGFSKVTRVSNSASEKEIGRAMTPVMKHSISNPISPKSHRSTLSPVGCSPYKVHKKSASSSFSIRSNEDQITLLTRHLKEKEDEISQLKQDLIDRDDSYFKLNQVRALREDTLVKERNFYYGKLVNIEALLIQAGEERELTPMEQTIQDILYSTEGMPGVSVSNKNHSVNSDDRASLGEVQKED